MDGSWKYRPRLDPSTGEAADTVKCVDRPAGRRNRAAGRHDQKTEPEREQEPKQEPGQEPEPEQEPEQEPGQELKQAHLTSRTEPVLVKG